MRDGLQPAASDRGGRVRLAKPAALAPFDFHFQRRAARQSLAERTNRSAKKETRKALQDYTMRCKKD